jgi:hypothetical protein
MKTEKLMKWMGATAGLCLAFGLTARAEEGSSTNAPAKHHGGPGLHRGAGGGGEFGGASSEEIQKFREKLKDMTPEQRQEAIQKFRQKMGAKAGGGEADGANREEMAKFREKLKDMTPEQRQEAIQKFREKMGAKGGGAGGEQWRDKLKDMTPEQRREAMQKMGDKMKERVEQSDKLTADQKKEVLAHMAQMKAAREKIMSDASLTEEQKREAQQKLREKSREMFEKYREALGDGQGQHKAGGPAKAGGQKPVEAKPSV